MADFFGSNTPFAEPLWYSRPGNPHYSDSHRKLREEIRRYVDTEIEPFCSEWEANGFVPKAVLKRHSELGYTAIQVNPSVIGRYLGDTQLPGGITPEEWDSFHDLIAIDEMARCGSLGVLWALGCGNAIGCPPVINFGTEEQKSKWLPRVIQGDIRFCLGITEPQAGSDVAGISTTAHRQGSVFIVNGTKQWVTNGTFANYCTAAVRTGGARKDGISVLVIPLDLKGVSRTEVHNSGVASSGCATLEFNNVEVPAENLIGNLDEGFKLIMASFNHERLWIAGNCLRLARICLEDSYQHALTRMTFGKPLIDRQAIRLKFANVGMQIMSTYALVESLVQVRDSAFKRATHADEAGSNISGLCALAKVSAAKTAELAVRESQQILGGFGYTRSGPGARVERISRDLRVLVIGGGSEEILSEMSVNQERKDLERLSLIRNSTTG
ncbi:acyl-CoA dehydrogenase [Hypoxylon crocopeplum]|nr:acyl-CoA dehydrogenase [Hypoxylon crocopeplum]